MKIAAACAVAVLAASAVVVSEHRANADAPATSAIASRYLSIGNQNAGWLRASQIDAKSVGISFGVGMARGLYDSVAAAFTGPSRVDATIVDVDAKSPSALRNGSLTYLSSDGAELFTLGFHGLGIFKLTPDEVEAGGEAIRRVKAEMYIEQITFKAAPASYAATTR